MAEGATDALDALEPGQAGVFCRVSDADPEMLRYLAERGIRPGDSFEVVEKQPFGGPTFARFAERPRSTCSAGTWPARCGSSSRPSAAWT